MATDPRAWLAEVQERAENAVSIRDQSGVPIVTGYRVPDLATCIRTDHPAMAAMIIAVLDQHPGEMVCCVLHRGTRCPYCREHCKTCGDPTPCPTVRAITEHLPKEDA